jgi:hypothetical protein
LIEHPTTSAPLRNGHPPRDVRRDSEAKRADSVAAIQMLQAVGDVSIVSDLTESQHFADQFLAMHRRCNRKTMAVRKSRPYRHFLRSSLTVCVAFRADDAVRYALDLYRLHHSHPLTTVHSRKSCSEDLIGRFPETKHFFLVVDSVPALCSTRGLLGLNIENAETRDSIARWRPPAA